MFKNKIYEHELGGHELIIDGFSKEACSIWAGDNNHLLEVQLQKEWALELALSILKHFYNVEEGAGWFKVHGLNALKPCEFVQVTLTEEDKEWIKQRDASPTLRDFMQFHLNQWAECKHEFVDSKNRIRSKCLHCRKPHNEVEHQKAERPISEPPAPGSRSLPGSSKKKCSCYHPFCEH